MAKKKVDIKNVDDKQLDRLKSELEYKSKKWNAGWGRVVSFLAVLIPLLIFAWGYTSAKKDESFQFLTSIITNKNATHESISYAIKRLGKKYPLRSEDILRVLYQETTSDQIREETKEALINVFKSQVFFFVIDQITYKEKLAEITIENDEDSIIVTTSHALPEDSQPSYWIYLGNYTNKSEKRLNGYWVPQKEYMGYTTSLNVEKISKPDSLINLVVTSPREVNLRKTHDTSADVVETLEKGQKIKIINIEKIPRFKTSSTDRIWVEIELLSP